VETYRIVYEGFRDISHLVRVTVDIGRYTGNTDGPRGKGPGEISATLGYGKLGDRNANEEVPGRLAQQILSRRNNGKIILELGRNKRIICWDSKEVARGRREEKAIRVVRSAVNLRL
jgi:hypothetical protein